ncbi:hypothetical protein [Allokutzneria sp. NRRL B-24872]|uniref:hypothetical protein n=1 Tax=Allokutzneria sp. NRRL B-24872 TaxID=1137961 RepID=UPI00143D8A0B|nr:hypothetical protein [Allokutzneria sp. NRRL B-24872]
MDYVYIALLALAGFLIGGAYTLWKSMKLIAILLLVGAVLAGAGAVAWWISTT